MLLSILIVIGAIALDQITKYIVVGTLPLLPGHTYPLIENVFHFTYVENRGAAFSLFSGNTALLTVVTILLAIAIGVLIVKYRKHQSRLLKISLAMIFGGAVGNIIDRLALGYVVDFFDFRLINFAIFNVADCFICIGTVLLIIYLIFFHDKEVKRDSQNS